MKEISCKWFLDGSEENIFYNNFRYSQGDNVIPSIELLTDFDLTGLTVNAFFCLPSGLIVLQSDVDVTGNLVSFPILEEALVLAGIHKIEITLTGENEEQLTLPNGIKYEVLEVRSFESDVVLPTEQSETVAELANSLSISITTAQEADISLVDRISQADVRIASLEVLLGSDGSGHVLSDGAGTSYPHRSILKVLGATLTDDEANDTTLLTISASGTAATYTHNQVAALATWTISHNLGKRPSVTIVDSAGDVVIGDISYISDNEISVVFSSAFSGKAYLN